jgi:hypothetical protein
MIKLIEVFGRRVRFRTILGLEVSEESLADTGHSHLDHSKDDFLS